MLDLEILLALVAPLRTGDALMPGVTLTGLRAEPAPLLLLDDHGARVVVEVAPRVVGERSAAETEHFALSYRAGPGLAPRRGQELCRLLAGRVAGNEAQVVATLRADVDEEAGPRVRVVQATHALEPRDAPGAAHYGLSPYVGCLIGCRFCYAQSRLTPLRRLLGRTAAPWGSWVDVRSNLPALLREELATARPRPIKMTPIVSDPYQAVERRERLTRRCLEVMAEAPAFTPLVLTRSALVLDDLKRIAAMPGAHVGVSLPTLDEQVLAHFEPRAANASERMAVLRAFVDAGVATFAVVQPMLPGSVDALADALAGQVTSVHLDVLHGEEAAGADFSDVRFSMARDAAWQRGRAQQLATALHHRGVAVWRGELPPALMDAAM